MSEPVSAIRSASFFDLYSQGELPADAIDDFIERWHENEEPAARVAPLHAYLGLTEAEYASWVQDHGALSRIRDARQALPRGRISNQRD